MNLSDLDDLFTGDDEPEVEPDEWTTQQEASADALDNAIAADQMREAS